MSGKYTSHDINQLLTQLYRLQRLGIKVGLEHTKKLLHECGDPQNSFKSIHIAGTNGKGSTAATIASILQASGLRTGLYTSPHLIHFNERIRINGQWIPTEKIVDFLHTYLPVIHRIESTFFESTTAMAFSYFADQDVDVAVVETGLGGRLDSTNVLNPEVTVITPIDLDHQNLLGETLQKITMEKAGIIKTNVPLILAHQTEEVQNLVLEKAGEMNAPVKSIDENEIFDELNGLSGSHFHYQNNKYFMPLIGKHQVRNTLVAIESVKTFDPTIDDLYIKKGVRDVSWPGRMQKVHERPEIFYDVAHNAHGINALVQNISEFYTDKPIGIIALKADKNLADIATVLKKYFSVLLVTKYGHPDLMKEEELCTKLRFHGIQCQMVNSFSAAVRELIKRLNRNTPGIIFGSHYMAQEVSEYFHVPMGCNNV